MFQIIRLSTGRIAYGVIEVHPRRRGVHCARQIAVPWNVLHPDRIDDCLRIDAPRARIEGAPVLPPDMGARRVPRRWAKTVHDYFGCIPYWKQEKLH